MQTLPPDAQQSFRPGPQTPPGLYGDESAQVAFNIGGRIDALRPFVVPAVAIRDRLSEGGETDLTRWFLAAALGLLLFDLMLSFWLRGLLAGALRVPPRRVATTALAVVAVAGGLAGLPLRDAREVFEREYLVAQISRFGGNISRTAEFVGMERSALHRKLKALGID